MVDTFLKDHVAVVTGGAKGLGKAISLALSARGAAIALVGRQTDAGLPFCSRGLEDQDGAALG
jgi:NAD(P)-dependent dehydrogenase (short-subunit alcohol dehydrogenase family)